MAHHKSAIKRIRQTKKRNYFNRQKKKALRLAVRAVREEKDYAAASEKLKTVLSILDRMSVKGIIHKNTAANKKSSLALAVNKLKQA